MMGVSRASLRSTELIENFDLRYYHPQMMSLTDLAFEIRISNLKENVLKKVPLSKVGDLYYSVYWISPGKFHIEVHGLPKGYKELRNELKSLVKSRLNFILPQKLAPKLRGYSFKEASESKSLKLEGVDITHQKKVNRVEVIFNKLGMLKSFTARSPAGSQRSDLEMSTKSWSRNKWVIDNILVTSKQGPQIIKMNSKVAYKKVEGFGFPSKVTVTTTQEIKLSNKKTEPRMAKSEITFSNYKVNKGIAKKVIMGLGEKK